MAPIRLPINLGEDTKGERRLAAIKQLAAAGNHYYNGEPSPGRWVSAQADCQLFYAVASDNNNAPDSLTVIRFRKTPSRKNMSRDECEMGWLGETNGIDKQALGQHTSASARALLRDNGVKIPQTVPVRHNVPYFIGGSEGAEARNKRDAYPWQGPWAGLPDSEIRWCHEPQRILDVRVIDCTEPGFDPRFEIVITAAESAASRTWRLINNSWDDETAARHYANALLDKIFDAVMLEVYLPQVPEQ